MFIDILNTHVDMIISFEIAWAMPCEYITDIAIDISYVLGKFEQFAQTYSLLLNIQRILAIEITCQIFKYLNMMTNGWAVLNARRAKGNATMESREGKWNASVDRSLAS